MDITVDEFMQQLNERMQNHPDYVAGYAAKANYMERGIDLFDANGNKVIPPGRCHAFEVCNTELAKEFKITY